MKIEIWILIQNKNKNKMHCSLKACKNVVIHGDTSFCVICLVVSLKVVRDTSCRLV